MGVTSGSSSATDVTLESLRAAMGMQQEAGSGVMQGAVTAIKRGTGLTSGVGVGTGLTSAVGMDTYL